MTATAAILAMLPALAAANGAIRLAEWFDELEGWAWRLAGPAIAGLALATFAVLYVSLITISALGLA